MVLMLFFSVREKNLLELGIFGQSKLLIDLLVMEDDNLWPLFSMTMNRLKDWLDCNVLNLGLYSKRLIQSLIVCFI